MCNSTWSGDVSIEVEPVAMLPALDVAAIPEALPIRLDLAQSLEEHAITILFVRDLLLEFLSPLGRFVTPVASVNISSPRVGGLDKLGSV
jgi:hypothetical protein